MIHILSLLFDKATYLAFFIQIAVLRTYTTDGNNRTIFIEKVQQSKAYMHGVKSHVCGIKHVCVLSGQ